MNEMETVSIGGSGVNIKKEIYYPVETGTVVEGEHNYDQTLLEIQKTENLEKVVSINDTVIDCDIGNNGQSTSISKDHELNKQTREDSKSASGQTRVKHNPTWYQCNSCCYKSKYKSRLKSHIRFKHDDNIVWYQCYFCSCKTTSEHDLLVHFQTQHDTDPVRYHCHHCNFETKNKQELSQHIKITHYKSNACFQCTFCKFKTVQEGSLKKHVEEHKLLKCSLCDYRTPKKRSLNHHKKLHHSKRPEWHQCRFCDFKTKYEQHLTAHVERKHNEDRVRKQGIEWFHCDSCEFKSTSLWYLEFHSKYSHNPTDKPDQCEFGTGETNVSLLNCDKNDTKEEECTNKCDFKIDDSFVHIEVKPDLALNLNDIDAQEDHHIDNSDPTIDLTSESCKNDTQYGQIDHCDFKHDPLQNFSENIKAHEEYINQNVVKTEQQPYVMLNFNENIIQQEYSYPSLGEELKLFQCDLCEFTSFNQWYLECHTKHAHNLTNDDNPVWYQCCYCSHKAESESSLQFHFHTEHNKNPVLYECHCCGFETKYKQHLAKHIKSLHKTSCFRCKFCRFRTVKESNLKRHIEQHQLLVCYVCDYRTAKKKYLRHHVKLHFRSKCEQNLNGHIHETVPSFLCKFCEFRAVNEKSWKRHIEQTHKLFACSVCDYKTQNNRNLSHHEKLRHNKSFIWYRCQFCRFKTKYEHNLKSHVKRIHNQDRLCKEEVEWFRCDSCEFKSTSLWYLEFHSKYSHNQTDELDQCEFKIREATDLLNSDNNDAEKRYP